MNVFVTSFVLLIVLAASTNSLKCKEGFTANAFGIPFYHWNDRECSAGSDCFVQELKTTMFKNDMKVDFKFGGCISSAYSEMVTCQNLFGTDSKLDPETIFNMVPDLDKKLQDFSNDLMFNATDSLRMMFSNGNGSREFIQGLVAFLQHFEFKTDKLEQLVDPISKCWDSLIGDSKFTTWQEYIEMRENATNGLFSALSKVDTKNDKISEDIYSFFGNWESVDMVAMIKNSSYFPLVENLPGLVKYTLPDYLKADVWYDVVFDLLGDVSVENPKKSAQEMIKTLKSLIHIPQAYKKYLDPIIDSIPDLVQQMAEGNSEYIGTWMAELMKSQSKTTIATMKLSNSVSNFVSSIMPGELPADFQTAITYAPGLFYSFFPNNINDIDRVYTELTSGFDSIDITNPTKTLPTTKMSDFLVKFTDKIISYPPGPEHDAGKQLKDLFVINFSKTFYNIMTSKYTKKLDVIFDTLAEDLKNYPDFDIEKIVTNVIKNLGWDVPIELKPLLNTAQGIYTAALNGTYDAITKAIDNTIQAYKITFPKSEIPSLIGSWVNFYYFAITGQRSLMKDLDTTYSGCDNDLGYAEWNDCYNRKLYVYLQHKLTYFMKIATKQTSVMIDTFVAAFHLLNGKSEIITNALLSAFPEFSTSIHLSQTWNMEDVKELASVFLKWTYNSTLNYPQRSNITDLVAMMNVTIMRLTEKYVKDTQEIRYLLAPDSCKYAYCPKDLCNTDDLLATAKEFIKTVTTSSTVTPSSMPLSAVTSPTLHSTTMKNTGKDKDRVLPDEPSKTTKPNSKGKSQATTTETTTLGSGSGTIGATMLLNIATLWFACKVIFL
ncbi:uncharacterized protein LOC144420998 [Styela clava]